MMTEMQVTEDPKGSISSQFEELRRMSTILKGETVSDRKARLTKLLRWLMSNRQRVKDAVYADFRKPAVEVDISEIYPVIGEVKHALKNLERWSQPTKVDAPINYLGTWSEIHNEPKGVCLIISPWNFPFNLCVGPLVSCLAAGNAALLKPSEATPHTSRLIGEMVREVFDGEVVVVEGDKDVAASLLDLPFDHIFFTGSPAVGKIVMRAAASHLTSVTLELGGKSPAIIDRSARLREAAKRIAFGKFLNNGQTCIAPDYVLVHEDKKEEFIGYLKSQVTTLFGQGQTITKESDSYGRVVNDQHFGRLREMLEDAIEHGAKLEYSGEIHRESRFFHPVIMTGVSMNAQVMNEEIFGPILPILTFKDPEEVIEIVNSKPKPLALYIFSTSRAFMDAILGRTSSGTVCVNDCVTQFTHPNLPFGGVNNSGIGKSHGYYGFMAFSNEKPVLKQKRGFALAYLFHPPFSKRMRTLLEPIIRWF
ncbi:MAG TPA: aldehyde dehydrogenase family protein [Cyclobacteriaceae bacterium]|nr:aldehyde dehydrogenase family protein [Cyclobacteriaceae bacterium]